MSKVLGKAYICNFFSGCQQNKVALTTTSTTTNPVWNQSFEFNENDGDEYLNVKCFSEEIFGDENIGSANVNLEGLGDGSIKVEWIPHEGVSSVN